ncbi:MAG: hypothetical protein KH009_03735 [Clostridiales bacterium]|nr:hypothetical protein [Clostridiales bacterium]
MINENKLNLTGYRISKVEMDFEGVPEGNHQIQLNTMFNVLTPQEESNRNCIVIVRSEFYQENNKKILSATIRATVEASERSDDIADRIREEMVPTIYGHLRDFISALLKEAHIEFIGLPQYDDLKA